MENWKDDFRNKTILELRTVINNIAKFPKDQVTYAGELLTQKRLDLKQHNVKLATEINTYLQKQVWFDFVVTNYDGYKLTIEGGTDLENYTMLEIKFEDVHFVSGKMQGWSSDTELPVFVIPQNEYELNLKYEIEQDYQLFAFNMEYQTNLFLIASNTLTYKIAK